MSSKRNARPDGRAFPRPGSPGRTAHRLDDDEQPGAAIAAMAAPDTLLVMATHGRTGVRRAVLGSVAEKVLRSAADPVLLAGPHLEPDRPIFGGRLNGRDPAARLMDMAARLPAAAIALTTHGRTGLPRLVLGSVAMEVVHRAPCPVLVGRSSAGG